MTQNTGARCWYSNDSTTYAATYGALYNWYAVSNTSGLCPTGWHVPSDLEWQTLEIFLGMSQAVANMQDERGTDEGGKMKEVGTTHWNSPNTGATNSSGFTALPGGYRFHLMGDFVDIGESGNWWSSSNIMGDPQKAWRRSVNCYSNLVARPVSSQGNNVLNGYSVRCVKDSLSSSAYLPTLTTDAVTYITSTSAISGGNVTSDGGATITARGVCWSTSPSPTIANNSTSTGIGTGSFTSSLTGLTQSTIYYVRAYATNSAGTGYGNEVNFTTTGSTTGIPCPGMPTLTDYNGNIYNTVQIGTQCWMKENLKARNYRNGASIPLVTDNTTWTGLSTGARCWYNNDSATYANTYGALYNWFAVDNANGLCPTGWHVPTDAEWTVLTDFLGGSSVAGGPLKETGTAYWNSPNTGATNSSGFTAFPGGFRYNANGNFSNIGNGGYWWSSTAYSTADAWGRILFSFDSDVTRGLSTKKSGFSVRCVRDSMGASVSIPTITTDAVTSITPTSAISGGNVTSDGGAVVTTRGVCWSTSPNPTIANNSTSNGIGTGSFTSSLTGLTQSTIYYVRAYATNSAGTGYGNEVNFTTTGSATGVPCPGMPTMTDYNGNIYNTVQIGNQCWMKENLKSRNYKNGTAIPNIISNSTWAGLSTGARCWYNNDSATYAATYGALYNWYAVDNSNGICPTGWHVPTDLEWQTMEMFLGMTQSQANSTGYRGTDEGGKMKEAGLSHWTSPNTGATNSSGFTALPGGYRYGSNGSFNLVGYLGYWWSSTAYSTTLAWGRRLDYSTSSVYRSYNSKEFGFSVRCVRDY
jgi:uncharacterized protein (TIGR02145 family)